MIVRRLFHALPVFALTLFILLLLDLQLRTRSDQKTTAPFAHEKTPRSTALSQNRDAVNDKQSLQRQKFREVKPHPPLGLSDIFIAVKTTGRFHKTRLALLLETWISRTKDHVSVPY